MIPCKELKSLVINEIFDNVRIIGAEEEVANSLDDPILLYSNG